MKGRSLLNQKLGLVHEPQSSEQMLMLNTEASVINVMHTSACLVSLRVIGCKEYNLFTFLVLRI